MSGRRPQACSHCGEKVIGKGWPCPCGEVMCGADCAYEHDFKCKWEVDE